MKILPYFYFLFQFGQCIYCPYSYDNQLEMQTIGDPQDLNWFSFDFTPKVTVIYWFKYQPLRTGEKSLSADVVNQMISYQIDLYATLSVVHYLQLDQQQKKIQSVFQIINSESLVIRLEYKILSFEGRWVAYKIYYDTEIPKITISTIVDQDIEFSENSLQNSRIWGQDYFLEFNYITNLYKYGNFFTQSVLTKFTGMVSYGISSETIPDIQEFAVQCSFTEKCTEEIISLISEEQKFQGLNYMSLQTGLIDRNNYMIYGWVKCAQFLQISDKLSVALRMSFYPDSTDDAKIGDKVLYIQYQQSLKSSSNKIIISTYSYEFPLIHSYQTQEEDTIIIDFANLQQSILQWHQFYKNIIVLSLQFFFSYENTEQPYISFYFPSNNNQPRKYTWGKQLNHLSGADFALSIGGDKFASDNFIGSISNFKVQNCPSNPNLQILNCHPSCNECFGPTNQNCLSCFEGRIYNLAQNTCLCPEGSFEPECKYFTDIYPFMIQIEIEVQNQLNLNYCDFGEFIYQNICIQCSQNIHSDIGLYCADCLENPLTWQNSLMCTYDYRTYLDESQNVYKRIDRYEINYNFYKVSKDQLELCVGCAQDGKCLKGFYQELDQCFLCSDGCSQCSSFRICTQCRSDYQLTQQFTCEQFKSCKTCKIQKNVEICLSCPEQFALSNKQICQPCGIQCGGCNNRNCLYCSDSNMFVSYDGLNCETCSIKNCLFCFQFRSSKHSYNTFNKFYIYEYQVMRQYSEEIQYGCAVCENGYYLDKKTLLCYINIQIDSNCRQVIMDENGQKICLIGDTNAIQQKQCNVINCLECIKQYKDNSDYCIRCTQGYYASARTGKCEECPQKCQNCIQSNTGYNDTQIWNIRAFYEYMFDLNVQNKNFLEYATSPYDSGYTVLCQSCQAGYILYQNECLNSCEQNCNKCEIINGRPTCIQCKGSLVGAQKSYLDNQCLVCPLYCEFCLPRQQVYNQFYESNYGSVYQCFESTKYIDSDGIVTKCKNMKKCEQKIKIQLNVYCDAISFQSELSKSNDQNTFQQKNILLEDLFQWTSKFESAYMYKVLNEQSIKKIEMEFNILANSVQCQIPPQGIIYSNLISNVFSLKQLDITIQSQNKCSFLISDSFSLLNFTGINIKNIELTTQNYNGRLIIDNTYLLISINFQNITILQQDNNQIQFILDKVMIMALNNLSILNYQMLQKNSLFQINMQNLLPIFLQIDQFSMINSSFQKVQIFNFQDFKLSNNNQFIFENISIFNCVFEESAFFQTNGAQYRIGSLQMAKFQLKNVTFRASQLIYSDTLAIFKCQNFTKCESINLDFISYQYALIQIESDYLSLKNVVIHRGYGYPEITIITYKQIVIELMQIDLLKKYFCKTFHQTFECIKDQIWLNQHYIIYIGEYQSVNINNLVIKDCITINYPLFIFNSIDRNKLLQKETIYIGNSIFNKNTLLLTELNYQTTILYISSMQQLKLIIENVTFSNNYLHQYQSDENQISTATFLINAYLTEVSLQNASIFSNCVTNSTNSIFYIFSKILNLNSAKIISNNVLNLDNLKNNLNFQALEEVNENLLKSIFQINSIYGVGTLKQFSLNIDNLYLSNSYGVVVGVFYIQMIKEGLISITNSIISSIQSKLMQTNITQAGFLFIDCSVSSLQLKISNISLDYIYSRTGGSIYIVPSKVSNQIILANVFVHNLYSFGCSLIKIESSEIVTTISSLEIKNLFINNTIGVTDSLKYNIHINQQESISQMFQGYEYLQKYEVLQDYEKIQIRTDNPMIQTDFSDIQIRNCQINNAVFTYFLKAEQIINLIIENFQFQQNQLILSRVIRIKPNKLYQSSIKLSNIQLDSFDSIWIQQTIDCSNINVQATSYTMACGNLKFDQQINDIDQSSLKYLECNLQSIFKQQQPSNFGLIELIEIGNISNVLIENLIVTNINCTDCTYGILSIQNITSYSINLNNIILTNNICGIIGCINMLKSIQNPNEFKVNQSQNRILSENIQNIETDILTINFQIVIQRSIFLNNTSDFGGTLFLERVNILIKECIFQLNVARQSGGSIYYISENEDLILYQTQIIENQAILGASLYLDSYQLNPYSKMGVLIQNSKFDSDIAETPSSLSISAIPSKVWFETEEIMNYSGNVVYQINQNSQNILYFPSEIFNIEKQTYVPMNLTLRILALNQFNTLMVNLKDNFCLLTSQLYNQSDQSIMNINQTKTYIDKQTVAFNETSGDFNLDNLIINLNPYNPGELLLRVIVECDMIKQPIFSNTPPYKVVSHNDHYQLYFYIRTLKCQVGEYYNDKTQACKQCNIDENQYSIKTNIDKCNIKNDVTMLEILPAMIKLKVGYWRPQYSNDQIEYCLHLENNCQGGWNYGDVSCAQGHIGALCEQCDLYNIRGQGSYALSNEYSCGSCELINHNVLQLVLVSLWTMISLYISVNSTNEAMDEQILKQFFRIQRGVPIYSSISSTAILIKILTNYLQIIGVISTFQLQINSVVFSIIQNMNNPVESMLYSQDCFLIRMTDINILYFRAIWTIIITIIYLVVFVVLYQIAILLKYQKYKFSIISTAAIYIYIYLQPNLISTNIKILSYREISQIKWVLGNVSMKYVTSSHLIWLSVFILPFIFIVGVLFPTLLFFKLFNNQKSLVKIQFRKQWGYLYNEYHKDAYYWEFIKIIQKMLIIFFITFYQDQIEVKALLGLLMIFIYSYICQYQKPYLAGKLNKIDLWQTNICAATYILALITYSSQQYQLQGINFVCYIVIGLINIVFILFLLWKIIDTFLIMLHERVDRLKLITIAKFPQLNQLTFLKKYLETTQSRQQRIQKRFKMIKEYLFSQIKKNTIKVTRNLQYSMKYMPG